MLRQSYILYSYRLLTPDLVPRKIHPENESSHFIFLLTECECILTFKCPRMDRGTYDNAPKYTGRLDTYATQ